LIHVDISKSNELRGQKGHQREITGQLQQNPLKGNWSKYGTIGRKIHQDLSLWNVQHRLLWTGEKRIKTKWSVTFFSGSKKTAGQHFHQAGITNSGMISSAIQLFAEDF
jgi:hypothetical protein